jgi:RHS repeat-associated protein
MTYSGTGPLSMNGIRIQSGASNLKVSGTGDFAGLLLTNVAFIGNGSGAHGLFIKQNGRVTGVTVADSTFENHGQSGMLIQKGTAVDTNVEDVAISGSTFANNGEYGLRIDPHVTNLAVSTSGISGNAIDGLLLLDASGVNVDRVTITGNRNGILFIPLTAGQSIANVTMTDVTVNDNTRFISGQYGSGMTLTGTAGPISTITATRCSFNSNAVHGVAVSGAVSGVTIGCSSIVGNAQHGIRNDATPDALVLAEEVYWGCAGGAGVPGCSTVAGSVDVSPHRTSETQTCGAPAPLIEFLSVSPDGGLLDAGDSLQLSAALRMSDDTTTDVTSSVTWTSNSPGVASIDANGLVQAHVAGTTFITAENPGTSHTRTVTITVLSPLASLSLTPTVGHLTVGSDRILTLTGNHGGDVAIDLRARATWSTSDSSIATVTSGLVVAHAVGTVTITATVDGHSASATIVTEAANPTPPEPSTIAPPIDQTKVTTVFDSTRFLFEATPRVQTGVDPGAIERRRAAVLHGSVVLRGGTPLPGVRVRVLGHPEYGQTYTRADGRYDILVNGGTSATVMLDKDGYLAVHRPARDLQWDTWRRLGDAVMIPLDPAITTIDFAQPGIQVAQGSVSSDADGVRRPLMLFMPGTTATIRMRDGSMVPAPRLDVRATEYTVGEDAWRAMPAPLPAQMSMTYCVELSADEALAANAASVELSKPAIFYLENFANLPPGGIVPIGYYDREQGIWMPTPNGRVVMIVGIEGGRAYLDVDGDAHSDDSDALIGTTIAERERLAGLYGVGAQLWRIPIPHFTPWDANLGFLLPGDATAPPGTEPSVGDLSVCSYLASGSIIECEAQVLRESLPVTGTPFTLSYSSARVEGRKDVRVIRVALTGGSVSTSLRSIRVDVHVVGRNFFHEDRDKSPNRTIEFEWDGKDGFGRPVQGKTQFFGSVSYEYPLVVAAPNVVPAAFAAGPGESSVSIAGPRQMAGVYIPYVNDPTGMVTRWWQTDVEVTGGNWDARGAGLGGWTVDVHHFYDYRGQVLQMGDGTRRSAKAMGPVIRTIAGNGEVGSESPDGVPATQTSLAFPQAVAVDETGTVTIADGGRVRRVNKLTGIITTVAGGGSDSPRNNAPARSVSMQPSDVAIGSGGTLYIADEGAGFVWRLEGGILKTVAGLGDGAPDPEHPPANGKNARHVNLAPSGIAIGPDGSLYIADQTLERVLRVGNDGTILTIAQIPGAARVDVSPLGVIFVAGFGNEVTRILPSGNRKQIIAPELTDTGGYGVSAAPPYGLAVRGESIYSAHSASDNIIRSAIEGDERIVTIAGGGEVELVDGSFASAGFLNSPRDVAVGPDGRVYIAESGAAKVRVIESAFPSMATEYRIASTDGAEVYHFDLDGRHLRTVDSITGVTLYEFEYTEGVLSAIVDRDGNRTEIGESFVAPGGQTTQLGSGEYLSSITNPAGEQYRFTYSNGLMTSMTTPRDHRFDFDYDERGRLTQDADPAGGSTALDRDGSNTDYTIVRRMAEGTEIRHDVTIERDSSERTITMPDGQTATIETTDSGSSTTTTSTGVVSESFTRSDPRFGMHAPVRSGSMTLPGGFTQSGSSSRSVTLENPGDPFSAVLSAAWTNIAGSQVATAFYEASTRSLTFTATSGRTARAVLDELGRVVSTEVPGRLPVEREYDQRGLLRELSQGTRRVTLDYDSGMRLTSVTDALGRVTQFGYDAADRVTSVAMPGARTVSLLFDDNGNVESVTPPGKSAHTFAHTPVDLPSRYDPPLLAGTGATAYSYDRERRPLEIARPGGVALDLTYDDAGRWSTLTTPEGVFTAAYEAGNGLLESISGPDGALHYAYDPNLLLTGVTWQGTAVTGSVAWTFDGDLALSTETVPCPTLFTVACAPVTFTYDDDKLLTGAGAMTLTRDPGNGALTATSAGVLADELTYDQHGELATYVMRNGGAVLFSQDVTRDNGGRITKSVETSPNGTVIIDYGYDAAGRLFEVRRDGVLTASYTYDDNGNRVMKTTPSGVSTASCDGQDRLSSYGNAVYTYTPDGELLTKTDSSGVTQYTYDALGSLLGVTLPDGGEIEYVTDPTGRRIAKTVDGTVVQRLLYSDDLRPAGEVDANGDVIARYVYASRSNVPDLIIRGETTFRIVTDHLGSPRFVVNTSSGDIVQAVTYDEFGNVLTDTNPGFQPFGFAGGLYDGDTGLVQFGARDYDAEIGRWTAKDPILFAGGDANLYAYVLNDPINLIDPMGTDWLDALEVVSDFSAGFGDTLTFGATDWIRDQIGGNESVDKCSGAYAWGQRAELGFEIAATGGSGALRGLAARASRKQVYAAAKRATSKFAGSGGTVHHVNPLFGHPGGRNVAPTLFPTGGLPASIHSSTWNLKRLSWPEHLAAHRHLRQMESLGRTAVNPATTGARAALTAGDCGCP